MVNKTDLTKEKMICDLYAISYEMGEWGRYLIIERNKTTNEVLEAMQRMVKYVQDK